MKNKRYIALMILPLLLLGGCDPWDGGSAMRYQAASMLGQTNATLEMLQIQADEFKIQLAETISATNDPVVKDELEKLSDKVSDLQTKTSKVEEVVKEVGEAFDKSFDENGDLIAGEAITAIGTLAAPFTGPYAPITILVTTLLGKWLGEKRGRKRGVTEGATLTALPIESARRKDLEAKYLKENPLNEPVIIFTKSLASIGHGSNGVKKAISEVS